MTDQSLLYEDEAIIAVNKPTGQAVIPGRGIEDGDVLVRQVEARIGIKTYVVHRIDRDTSGVVLFAKDAATHKNLSIQFEKHEVRKQYLALVFGIVETGGTIDRPLREFGSGRMGIDPKGKPAQTEFSVRQKFGAATLLDVMPRTGRRHQIRAHLYGIGHPVIGDTVYGKERPVAGAARLMLHARSIAFLHPSGKSMVVTAEPDALWTEVLRGFGGNAGEISATL